VSSPQARAATALLPGSYGAAAYLAYVLYPPLYVAGPVLTFNGFASQLLRPRPIAVAQVPPATQQRRKLGRIAHGF